MTNDGEAPKSLAIEGNLPLKAVGIENMKENNPKHMPPHRYLHPWFARRPTPAARLAILASLLPQSVSNDEILDLMQIGPKEGVENISEYVESKKATEDSRSGTLGEHYGYDRPFTSTPSEEQRQELHETLTDHWGEVPNVLDPTAGGGVIPFESLRYGLPTMANELNPVPILILKSMVEFPLSIGSIEDDLRKWANEIDERATDALQDFFPTVKEGREISHYAVTYSVSCPSCGCEMPMAPSWWLLKRSASKGVAVRPEVTNGEVEYELVQLPEDVTKSEFNPQDGPRSRGSVSCLNCDVVTEDDEIKERFKEDDFEYEILGAKYIDRNGKSGYRAPVPADYEALERAKEKTNSDFELFDLLTHQIPAGKETERTGRHGINEWRDLFSPRQLVAHYEYLQAFEECKEEIRSQYDEETATAISTILSLSASKLIDRNCRLSPYSINRGYPENALGGKSYAFQWLFVDNNPSAGDQCYLDVVDRVVNSYEDLVAQVEDASDEPATLTNRDAADLPYDDGSVQSVIMDPPYYSSVMYAELSDIFYVWLRHYLGDTYPDMFEGRLTEKEEEAVANPAGFDQVSGDTSSKKQLARERYEQKMADIFTEANRVLEDGGVMTVMFTHKETDAWDTLTRSLIDSEFTITATHPITSEIPHRMDVRGGGSADSTLLLVGRKVPQKSSDEVSLWSDVRSDTREAAERAARDLLESGLSLTKTDIIISAFGPTLRVFADAYPVVDDTGDEVPPKRALEEAREAVTQVLVDEFLNVEGVSEIDDVSEWYVLCWLVHGRQTIPYDEGRQLGIGLGIDIDEIKRSTKVWGRSRGDIQLKMYSDRVQNAHKKPENRSSRKPVDPDSLSFPHDLDKVHAAIEIYDTQGESACCDWLQERGLDSDPTFKMTIKSLLQVIPKDTDDWELIRNLTVGRTQDLLGLDIDPSLFQDAGDDGTQTKLTDL